MNPTPQQQAFTDALTQTSSNLALIAVAGAGKTSTIVYGLSKLPQSQPAWCCAFNKRIATELQQRLPAHIQAKTMNALGHGAWIKQLSGRKIVLEADKTWKIAKEWDIHFKYPDLIRLVGQAKNAGLVPQGAPMGIGGLVPDDDASWQSIIDYFDLDSGDHTPESMIADARRLLKESCLRAFNGLIDFDDQVYMSVLWKAPFTRLPLVVVDEAQDLSPLQHEMLPRLGKRIVAVGDPRQAIYGFRGADSQSMPTLIRRFEMLELPLTFSFRCPKAVVLEAQQYVQHIQSVPTAPEGIVRRLGKWNLEQELTTGTAVVCRNTKPLVALALKALARRLPVTILGRDIGKSLLRMVTRWKTQALNEALIRLDAWADIEARKLTLQGKHGQAELLRDKLAAIEALCDAITGNTVAEFEELINSLFSDKAGIVTLGTVHKMKGFEYPRVIFLDANLIPSKWAREGWQLEQEYNIAYVAVTRAQKELIYADSDKVEDKDVSR